MLLCALSVLVMVFGLVAICLTIFLHMEIMFLIYAGLIALLMSMVLNKFYASSINAHFKA